MASLSPAYWDTIAGRRDNHRVFLSDVGEIQSLRLAVAESKSARSASDDANTYFLAS